MHFDSRADEAAALMAGSQVLHYSGGEDSKKPPKQPQKVPDSCSSSQAASVQPQPAAAAAEDRKPRLRPINADPAAECSCVSDALTLTSSLRIEVGALAVDSW